MQEGQVTIGEQTFELPKPFMVLATQNPLEQEGTFLLPEAQLDRFLLKTLVDYPSMQEEKIILQDMLIRERAEISQILSPEDIFAIRSEIDSVEVSESIYDYICSISAASRDTNRFPEIAY